MKKLLFRKQLLGHIGVDKLVLENIYWISSGDFSPTQVVDPGRPHSHPRLQGPRNPDRGGDLWQDCSSPWPPSWLQDADPASAIGQSLGGCWSFCRLANSSFHQDGKKRSADAMEDADLQGPRTVLEQFHIIIGAHWHFLMLNAVFCFLLEELPYWRVYEGRETEDSTQDRTLFCAFGRFQLAPWSF